MDDARIGRALRMLRHRRGLRQVDLAAAAGLSQSTISTIEAGHFASLPTATTRRVFSEVGASLETRVRWRGADLDRLLDERHGALVGLSVSLLRRFAWLVEVEVTFSIYGERGSIDVLGAHTPTRTCLVVEVKSELVSLEELGRTTDAKLRLARQQLCRERFGWAPSAVGRVIVLPATDAARRSVRRHASVLDAVFPLRGTELRRWLRAPVGPASGLLFVADIGHGGATSDRRGAHRIRVPSRRRP